MCLEVDAKSELRRTFLTCLLREDTFYEKSSDIAKRMAALAAENQPEVVAALAREARDKMQLRHAPLFLVRGLARRKGPGTLVAETLGHAIQRADELGKFVALYWKEKKQPLSAGVKRELARAFTKFDAYQLGKYDRESVVRATCCSSATRSPGTKRRRRFGRSSLRTRSNQCRSDEKFREAAMLTVKLRSFPESTCAPTGPEGTVNFTIPGHLSRDE